MKNAHVARLDRQLRQHGEPVLIRHSQMAVPRHQVETRGIVKTFARERLIGGLTQTNYMIIVSPTDLRRSGFPGAEPATIPSGTMPAEDTSLPDTAGHVVFRGRTTGIMGVDAIYDGDEVVRIELKVIG